MKLYALVARFALATNTMGKKDRLRENFSARDR